LGTELITIATFSSTPIAATIRGPEPRIISENIGAVDVCINVSNAELIPVGGAEIEVFVTNQGVDPATRKPQGNKSNETCN
jgi:hypothetical protein